MRKYGLSLLIGVLCASLLALPALGDGDLSLHHGQIEDSGVTPETGFSSGDLSLHHDEIEVGDVAPETGFAEGDLTYEHDEIEAEDVRPVIEFTTDFGTYEVPEIRDASPELASYYSDLLATLDHQQLTDLAELTPMQAAEFVGLQHELIDDLVEALEMEGIDIAFNRTTGTACMDASLLYGVDQYAVTDAGKAMLKEVMGAYAGVLSRDKYRDHIDRVTIVGHTDSDGSYDYNLELSRKRAQAVYDFCLSDECGIDQADWLAGVLSAEGHSYDERIYRADGSEDKAASRRVEIGFRIAMN